MKKTKPNEVQNKEFKVLFPFQVKEEGTSEDIIKIEGYANWCGEAENMYVDLSGDVVVPDGVDLSVYKRNPQILLNHNRSVTIGKGLKIEKKKDGLFITAEIHAAAMEPEEFYRIKAGLLTQFSIGFRVKKVEWKEVDGKEVCFIIKSLLLEVSIVSVPCNSMSAFQLVKSMDGGFYSGELGIENFSEQIENKNQDHKEDGDTMKIKIADKYSATEIEKMQKLGLVSGADAEIEISVKDYVDLAIDEITKADAMGAGAKMRGMVKEVCKEVVMEMMDEMAAAKKAAEDLVIKEAEDKAKAELAEKLAITVEDLEKMSDEEIETKVKELENKIEEEEFTADELLALKELAHEQNEYLKSFIDEEK